MPMSEAAEPWSRPGWHGRACIAVVHMLHGWELASLPCYWGLKRNDIACNDLLVKLRRLKAFSPLLISDLFVRQKCCDHGAGGHTARPLVPHGMIRLETVSL